MVQRYVINFYVHLTRTRYRKSPFSEVTTVFLCCAMISDADFNNDMWLGPGIWVPPVVADYLISRTQWMREGEKGDFQVEVPKGYEFEDLATLAYLIVTDDVVAARELADNIPRSMWMETSSSDSTTNQNHLKKNPFRR